jgi:phasin family protein
MIQRRTATKTPARKPASAGSGAAARKATARPRPKTKVPPALALAPASDADAASLYELAARLGKLELAGLAGRLVSGWRADLTAIVDASRKSYAGLQAVVARQTAQIGEAVAEMQGVGKVMSMVGPKESVRHLDDLALATLELALADIRELAALAARSQREAFDIVHERVNVNIDEVQRLLRSSERPPVTPKETPP